MNYNQSGARRGKYLTTIGRIRKINSTLIQMYVLSIGENIFSRISSSCHTILSINL